MFAPDTFLLSVPSTAVYAERHRAHEVTKSPQLVDWIDFDFDTGKNATTATITLEASQIPAGLGARLERAAAGCRPGLQRVPRERYPDRFLVGAGDARGDRAAHAAERGAGRRRVGGSKTTSKTSKSAGQKAVAWAANFLGKPYHSGGGHVSGLAAMISYGDAQLQQYVGGFDCSGLVRCAWAQQHVDVGGTTYDQHTRAISAGVLHGSGGPPSGGWMAGDLFYPVDPPDPFGHVVMMTGQGTQAIEAPHTGDVIKYLDVASAYGNKPAFWCRWAGAGT